MSRAIFAPPTTRPSRSLIGETDSETYTRLPSFVTRSVSKCSIRSPRTNVAMMVFSSVSRSGGRSMVMWQPIASSAV
jgi:hypothetical protein